MVDLTCKYLGLELKNPVIAGASALTQNMQTIKRIEEAGAGALVVSSLFEEQVQLSQFLLDESLQSGDGFYAEMTSMFPRVEHAGPEEHLMWVKRAKEAVSIPVIASLNAVNAGTWVEYAKKLEGAGADALELNFYSLPTDFDTDAAAVEAEQLKILAGVKKAVKIPVSVKLSSFYSSPLNFIKRLDAAGADGFVLFNRLFHPKVNIESCTNDLSFNLSSPQDHRLALRFAGLLYDNVSADVCASGGIHSSNEALGVLLAGADVFQMVSSLFRNKIEYIEVVLDEITEWMEDKKYASLADFRGKMSKKNNDDPWAYTRAKYITVLRQPGQYLMK
ncbi:MAG: dihydroorotate dehydrogenase-like protein [Spirochaetales bacterium]|nr:dihydroorotate dehydrogenase-like protein [Spirochaetales bacterium]